MAGLFFRALAPVATGAILIASPLSAEPVAADDLRVVAFENNLIARDDLESPDAPRWTIEDRIEENRVPGLAVAIIEGGEIVWTRGYGVKLAGGEDAIDTDTVFSVGSISKMANAAIILRLVAEGLVDLDTDVNEYLTSWKVPDNQYTRENKVTLRAILSHTAGFNQHGFRDFQPGEALPTALQTLDGQSPATHDPVRVMFTPGEKMDYSGGGVTVSQVLVENVTGLSYPEAARKYLFEPLGMTRSTFVNPLPESHGDIARAHDAQGAPAALPRGWEAMPEMAASGLWTSVNDLSCFVLTLMESYHGENDFLPQALIEDMMTRVPNSWHGLGPRLNGEGQTRVFHHGGANDSYRARIEGHLNTGAGIILLTNGLRGIELNREVRRSAEDAFNWAVKEDDGAYSPPDFVE
ncbi:MAG: serine hydrolase domain-containing protein [Pseudomonadota bacterium]